MCQADRPQEVLYKQQNLGAGAAVQQVKLLPAATASHTGKSRLLHFSFSSLRKQWRTTGLRTPANPVGDPEAALAMQPSETHWMEDSLNVQFFQIRKKKKKSKLKKKIAEPQARLC